MNEEFEKQKIILENLYRCRDLEINNLWQKGVFLAPFLILCFTGYGILLYELFKERPFSMGMNLLCIALCGISAIFSMLWIYMFKGSKAQYELCERAIVNYEKKLKFPIYYRMGTLRHNEIEFDNNLLRTKAGKFSPSKVNILIGQVSLKISLVAMIFHVGYLFSEILVRNCDGYNKFIRIESVYMISLFLFVFLFLLGLIYYLYRFFFQKGIKIESSYLSMNNEEKYIKDFNTIKALVFKESRGNCWFFIKSVFRSLCLLENKNKKTISTQKQFILQSLQEIYNISSERANQLEELAELTLSFPLTNKEEKYIEKCKEFVEKGGDIEKYKELLNCLASAIGIEKKRAEELIKNIKEKYQRKQ